MEINNAVSLYFSPTGSTRRIVTEIARNLPWPSRELDVTDHSANDEVRRMTARELLLAGVPVYGGRVPATAVRRLKNIRGGDTPAVIVAVFGNRDYDDALLELKDLLEGQGFRVAAALAAVAEHNIMRSVTGGRPDARDIEFIDNFAAKAAGKISAAVDVKELAPITVKGNRPYRGYGGVPFKPSADSGCVRCGLCAAKCPVRAIPEEAPNKTDDKKCVTCMRCVKICPQGARSLNKLLLCAAEKLFALKYSRREEYSSFL